MKKFLLVSFLTYSVIIVSFAQEQTVSGKIIDGSTQETLPGTTVQIKGTTTGTITDVEGNYQLQVADGSVLVVSFVGYATQEIAVGNQSIINVSLELDFEQLSEVVVIGYGTQKKKVVTGAIASVSAEEISATPILRVEQALQGRTPGVQVTNLSGQPGEEPTIRIRGTGSTVNSKPLYIVDGLAVGGIDYLNPGDIESMDVLKDAASAAIYGSRAANGVVLITTKSGVKGKLNISYSGYYGIQNVGKTIEMLNADEYKMMWNEGALNGDINLTDLLDNHPNLDLNLIPTHDTDWQDALFQKNAPMSNHQITVSGGNEKSTFSSSISVFSQEGIIGGEKSQFERITARLNSNHKVNKIFTFGNNLAYSHIDNKGIGSNQSFNGAYNSALNLDPLTPIYETDLLNDVPYSTSPVVSNGAGQVYGISSDLASEIVNPLALLEIDNDGTRVDKLVGNVYGELEPIENLKIKTSLGIDLAFVMYDGYRPLFYLNDNQKNIQTTSVTKTIDRYYTWQWENTLTYTKKINDHNIGGLVGITAKEDKSEGLVGTGHNVRTTDPDNVYLNLAIPDSANVDEAGGGAEHAALFSLFGRVTYDFKDKYSATVILRRDGSSKFGANNRFGIFPSVGVAWIASDEAFLQNLGPVNMLKLRASWGVNGNQEIGNYRFVSVQESTTRIYTFGTGPEFGASPEFIENQDIQWEESKQLDIGVDLGLYENKLTATIDYYNKKTEKLLDQIRIARHVGNAAPTVNAGNVENKGIELAFNWRENKGDFSYAVGINGGYNKNTMTYIANEQKVIPGARWGVSGAVTQSNEGRPISYFYGYKTDGIFQNQNEIFQYINLEGDPIQPSAVPGDVRFVDVNGDGVINEDDRTMIGNPTPDWTMGFNASVNYKNFDFSMLLTGAFGHQVFNGITRVDLHFTNLPKSALGRWTAEGTSNSMPRFTMNDTNGNEDPSDLYLENASYVKFKNVQFGYTLPKAILDKIGAVTWRFYISAENLLTITKYSGAEPEIGAMSPFDIGVDRAVYPQARTFRIGTTLTF